MLVFLKKKIQDSQRKSRLRGNILYVEDNEIEALIIEDYLKESGFDVETFDYAEDAFKVFQGKAI